jgi:ornithine cyclodeaminase
MAVAEGALAEQDLVPLRDLVDGTVVPPPARPLVFKSVGMSWQDLVVARAVVDSQPLR